MKKLFVFLVLVLVLTFEAKTSLAGVTLYFDFQGVSGVYVKFTYEFGSQFGAQVKRHHFLRDYTVQILEKERKIVALINEEEDPFIEVKVRDLDSEEKIRKKAKEFSDKIFDKLKELEKNRKIRITI